MAASDTRPSLGQNKPKMKLARTQPSHPALEEPKSGPSVPRTELPYLGPRVQYLSHSTVPSKTSTKDRPSLISLKVPHSALQWTL